MHTRVMVLCVCECVSAVYKLLTRLVLQIERISRLYANLPRFPTYRFLSNAFFHEVQHFRSFSMPSPPFCSSLKAQAPYTMRILRCTNTAIYSPSSAIYSWPHGRLL